MEGTEFIIFYLEFSKFLIKNLSVAVAFIHFINKFLQLVFLSFYKDVICLQILVLVRLNYFADTTAEVLYLLSEF